MRSPFRPSRPPVFRWHFTASRPRSAESGRCLRLRNSLMHGPFPRMHAGLPLMHAPFPGSAPFIRGNPPCIRANERCVSGNAPFIRPFGPFITRVAQAGTVRVPILKVSRKAAKRKERKMDEKKMKERPIIFLSCIFLSSLSLPALAPWRETFRSFRHSPPIFLSSRFFGGRVADPPILSKSELQATKPAPPARGERFFIASGQNGHCPPRTIVAKERIERKEFCAPCVLCG